MEYKEIINRLNEMESRFSDGFSSIDRTFLDALHFRMYGKEITRTGCSDCYRDAYLMILYKLKRDKTMPKQSNFVLKPGAIIQFFGEREIYVNSNLTDEAALRYLSLNKDNIVLFSQYPDDWESQVEAYLGNSEKEVESEAETSLKEVEDLKESLAAANEEIAELKMALAAANEEITNGDSAHQSTIEKLEGEIAELKKENKALKSANTRLKNASAKEMENEAPENPETEASEKTE